MGKRKKKPATENDKQSDAGVYALINERIHLVSLLTRQMLVDARMPDVFNSDIHIDVKDDANKQQLRGLIRFTVTGRYSDSKPQTAAPFQHISVFSLTYHNPTKVIVKGEAASSAFSHVAVRDAWPYWGELLNSTLLRMGLSQIVLPPASAIHDVKLEPHTSSDQSEPNTTSKTSAKKSPRKSTARGKK